MNEIMIGLFPAAKVMGVALLMTTCLVIPIMISARIGFFLDLVLIFLALAYGIGRGISQN